MCLKDRMTVMTRTSISTSDGASHVGCLLGLSRALFLWPRAHSFCALCFSRLCPHIAAYTDTQYYFYAAFIVCGSFFCFWIPSTCSLHIDYATSAVYSNYRYSIQIQMPRSWNGPPSYCSRHAFLQARKRTSLGTTSISTPLFCLWTSCPIYCLCTVSKINQLNDMCPGLEKSPTPGYVNVPFPRFKTQPKSVYVHTSPKTPFDVSMICGFRTLRSA